MRHGVPGPLAAMLLLPFLGLAAPDAAAEEHDQPTFWLGLAEAYARQITVPDGRAALLVSIGTGYVEAGATERALALLDKAVDFGAQCKGCLAKARRLAEIGVLLTRAGDPLLAGRAFEAARKAADELEDPVPRISARCVVAERSAEAGDVMPARILLGETEVLAKELEGMPKLKAWAALLSAWVATRDDAKARAAYEPIRRANRGTSAEYPAPSIGLVDQARLDLALSAARAGRYELAKERCDAIEGWEMRVAAWLVMAGTFEKPEVRSMCVQQAAEFAGTIPAPTLRASTHLDVASAADALGAKDVGNDARNEAYLALASVPTDEVTVPMVELLLTFAEQTRAAGSKDLARGALVLAETRTDAVAERENVDGMRRMLADAWARAGDLPRARKTLGGIEDPTTRILARLDLAEQMRCTGGPKAALGIAKELSQLEAAAKGEVLRRVAVLQARCAGYEQALETVRSIDRPFQAATACTYIARDLTP